LAGYDRPRIVVSAYNPHAGDGGLMGREEIDVIAPAIKKMTTEMTTDASQPGYNTSLLLGGDEQLKKLL